MAAVELAELREIGSFRLFGAEVGILLPAGGAPGVPAVGRDQASTRRWITGNEATHEEGTADLVRR